MYFMQCTLTTTYKQCVAELEVSAENFLIKEVVFVLRRQDISKVDIIWWWKVILTFLCFLFFFFLIDNVKTVKKLGNVTFAN